MATTLIPPAASAENTPRGDARRAVHAEADDRDRRHAGTHLDAVDLAPRAISSAELALRSATRARRANGSGTLKQIECSDDAWEMSDTEIRRAVQRGEGAGGDARHAEHAVAGDGDERLRRRRPRALSPAIRPAPTRSETSVPAANRDRRKGRTNTGIGAPVTGISARGWRTLAP